MARRTKSQRRRARATKEQSRAKRSHSRAATKGGSAASRGNLRQVFEMLDWLLPSDIQFAGLNVHGNTTWLPRTLVSLALCWAIAENKCVTDSFNYAARWMQAIFSGGGVLTTYQGMMNALTTWTSRLLPIIQTQFHDLMKRIGRDRWTVSGWVAIAFDGSTDEAPRTQSNEDAYCAQNYGKGTAARSKKTRHGKLKKGTRDKKPQPPAPRVWITLMWHVGLRLPWVWRLGRSTSSERSDVMNMIAEENFPENTLFLGDAGFVGYPLWHQILKHKFQFLVRVGGNVKLLSEYGHRVLKDNMTVLSWPQDAVHSKQPPLRLRLVQIRVGRTKMWLLTSVTDKSKLSINQIRNLYLQRWGIEVEFRGLKQTLDKGKLRCRNSDRVAVELHWSLIAMTAVELAALKHQMNHRPLPESSSGTPGRSSPTIDDQPHRSLAKSVRAIRWSLSHLNDAPPAGETLRDALRRAVVAPSKGDSVNKRARYCPPNPDHNKPLGEPKIRPVTHHEKSTLKQIQQKKLTP